MITLILKKASLEDLRIIDLWQTPISALEPFWYGSDEELDAFINEHDLAWSEVQSVYEGKLKAAELLDKMAKLFKTNIGKFDFRLSSSFNAKILVPINDIEIMNLDIDIVQLTEEQKKIITDSFFKLTSRSFLDFRQASSSLLRFFYSRRGYYDEEDKVGIYTSRTSYTIKENFKVAKDNNFILSGLCLELARALPEITFSYSYQNSVLGKKETFVSASELLDAPRQRKLIQMNQQSIEEQAKEELKIQKQKTRESLPQESLEQKIMEASSTQFRMNLNDNFDDYFTQGFEYYYAKEQEKFHLRLEKAKNESKEAYKYLRSQIDGGISLKEALDLVKQKYRDDDIVNLVALLLTKDILELSKKETEIATLKEEIQQHLKDYQNALEDISKKEQTITSLKSTLTTKINEFHLYKEQAEEQLYSLSQTAEEKMQQELQKIESILKEKEEALDAQDVLIDRMEIENTHLKQNSEELKNRLKQLEMQMKELQLENRELYAQVFHFKNHMQ